MTTALQSLIACLSALPRNSDLTLDSVSGLPPGERTTPWAIIIAAGAVLTAIGFDPDKRVIAVLDPDYEWRPFTIGTRARGPLLSPYIEGVAEEGLPTPVPARHIDAVFVYANDTTGDWLLTPGPVWLEPHLAELFGR